MEIILSIIVLICSSFLKNIQNTYIIKKKKEDDTELKVDDRGYNFDHEDEDKLLNLPELTK